MTIIMGIWNFFVLIYLSFTDWMFLWLISIVMYGAIWFSVIAYRAEPKSKPKNGKPKHHFWKNFWQNSSSQTKKNLKLLNYIYLGLTIIGLTSITFMGDMSLPTNNTRGESEQEKQQDNQTEAKQQASQYTGMHKYLKQQSQNPDLPKFEQNWYQHLLKTQTNNYLH